ncbi:galactokinase [Victivallis vadensis]|jgi:galactokinase|uniref:Galactokinase n=1 Tax=Victivallis vadensis TaxID=172901 RepID=A0A2U1AT46_9BACT|nr:galactokinase [Victivallis vadensis]NMD86374.1 galactokinase [Victivallis vadensis]PVY39531.1 galactokinase [Victivallis vadensis]HJH02652.1 galactokinase [Victivallis vadensis]
MEKLINDFTKFYGAAPTVAARAPGRLEILGNHTDYNQGFVLSCAVEQDTRFALRPVEGKHCRVKDFRDGSVREFDLDDIDKAIPRDWANYVKGVIVELRKRGIEVGAFDAGMESSVPLSAGMSSSAAFETAAGFAMREAFGIELSNADWARVGQGVENHYMGLKSGLLDQFSSIFGKKDSMILTDFRSVEVLRTVPLPAGYSIVVINSMVKHNLVDSEYNVRRQDCEAAAEKLAQIYPDVKTLRDVSLEQLAAAKSALTEREYRRALHVVGECTRVIEAVRMLEHNDVKGFGRLWFDSHESSRVNFENSTEELDYLVELAKSVPGGLGARLSGGGFGGITIHLVATDGAEEYAKRVQAGFKARTGIDAEYIICAIGDGATSRKL